MSTIFVSLSSNSPSSISFVSLPTNPRRRLSLPGGLRCGREDPSSPAGTDGDSPERENALLKVVWNASELLGIAASFLTSRDEGRRPAAAAVVVGDRELATRDGSGPVDRAAIVQAVRDDFQRSYFVTGDLTLDAYEEDCEFADPASSFKGLRRFKRNCTNFGSLLDKSDMKLMKWEDFEDKSIGHWRFSCILSFPWKPILSASGYTEYFFDPQSGKICRHVEHWNVPKMALLKQIIRPSRRSRSKST